MKYFLLALVLGYVLQFVASLALTNIVQKVSSTEELHTKNSFHLSIITYCLGTLFKYIGWATTIAYLVKELILT